MSERIEGEVDHFPHVLTHLSDQKLIAFTRTCVGRAQEGAKTPWDDCAKRLAMCRAECAKRRLSLSPVTARRFGAA